MNWWPEGLLAVVGVLDDQGVAQGEAGDQLAGFHADLLDSFNTS